MIRPVTDALTWYILSCGQDSIYGFPIRVSGNPTDQAPLQKCSIFRKKHSPKIPPNVNSNDMDYCRVPIDILRCSTTTATIRSVRMLPIFFNGHMYVSIHNFTLPTAQTPRKAQPRRSPHPTLTNPLLSIQLLSSLLTHLL
jgi:hypothetical protein